MNPADLKQLKQFVGNRQVMSLVGLICRLRCMQAGTDRDRNPYRRGFAALSAKLKRELVVEAQMHIATRGYQDSRKTILSGMRYEFRFRKALVASRARRRLDD